MWTDYRSQRRVASGSVSGVRANLVLQSQTIDNASWTKSGLAATPVIANSDVAPDGTITADRIVEQSGGTFHLIRQDSSVVANTIHTMSFYLKPGGRAWAKLQLSNTLENNGASVFANLATGSISSLTTFGSGSFQSAAIEPAANGFYRVQLSCIIDSSSTTGRSQLLIASDSSTINYAGDGVSGLVVWGAQLEDALSATSYIVTTSSTATGAGARSRLMSAHIISGAADSTVRFRDGTSTGVILAEIDAPAGTSNVSQPFIAERGGIVFRGGIYTEFNGSPTAVTINYQV